MCLFEQVQNHMTYSHHQDFYIIGRPFNAEDVGKLITRLTLGGLLILHGIHKIMNPEGVAFIQQVVVDAGLPGFVAYGVYIGEVIAPILLILGAFTRIGGLLVCINMLFAIGLMHWHSLFALSQHGSLQLELQYFYLFIGLAVAFLGSGRFATRPD